jgi:hypothetical protein
MTGFGIGAGLVGAGAFALATPALVAAVAEAPPAGRMPRPAIAVAAVSSLAFLVAVIGAVIFAAGLAVIGPLVAATELAAAAAIWLARGKPVGGDDNGGWTDARPEPPRGPDVPEEYWRGWEEQFTSPTSPWPRPTLVR